MNTCGNCGAETDLTHAICPKCSNPLTKLPKRQIRTGLVAKLDKKKAETYEVGRTLGVLSILSGAISIVFLGFVFGSIGLVLGLAAIANRRLDFGIAGILLSLAGLWVAFNYGTIIFYLMDLISMDRVRSSVFRRTASAKTNSV